jgi:hypothetical protein
VSWWYSGLTTIPILEAKRGVVNRSKVLIFKILDFRLMIYDLGLADSGGLTTD